MSDTKIVINKDVQEKLISVYRMSEAWNLKDILIKLTRATDILLIEKSYDGATYEEMQKCSTIAKEIILEIPRNLKLLHENQASEIKIDQSIEERAAKRMEGKEWFATYDAQITGYTEGGKHQQIIEQLKAKELIKKAISETANGVLDWLKEETDVIDKTTKAVIENCEIEIKKNCNPMIEKYVYPRLIQHGIVFTK